MKQINFLSNSNSSSSLDISSHKLVKTPKLGENVKDKSSQHSKSEKYLNK
jgi:hypothetical protein